MRKTFLQRRKRFVLRRIVKDLSAYEKKNIFMCYFSKIECFFFLASKNTLRQTQRNLYNKFTSKLFLEELYMATHIRQNILKILALISDKDLQISYQKSMQHVTMLYELLGLWDSEYFPEDTEFKKAFHKLEKEALADFHNVFEDIQNDPEYYVPDIDDFVKTTAWKRFSDAANTALKVFLEKDKELARRDLLSDHMKKSVSSF
jgi:hypothetical protein